jgi:ubiquinone biosynthesis protein COQ9
MFFDERYHIASLAAAETLKDPALGIHVERWCLLFVERAQPKVIATCMAQLHILSNHVYDVRLDTNFVDDMWRDAHEQL